MMWTKWGRVPKQLRNDFHFAMTAEIKFKNHNDEKSKVLEKVLRIVAEYITKWSQELKHILYFVSFVGGWRIKRGKKWCNPGLR